MSDGSNFGFAKLVPGFDFLQNIARGATQGLPQLPSLASWVAPTLNVEELEKRIADLKAVQFWLEQNGKALGATIQALEVQKMTLATLEGMNVSMGELANALQLKTAEAMGGGAQKAGAAAGAKAQPAREPADAPKAEAAAPKPGGNGSAGPVDPLQWWGALTQQFQQIAADAMKDVAQRADSARSLAAGAAKEARAGTRTAKEPAASAKASKTAAAPAPAVQPADKAAPKAPARKSRAKTASS
jgi:hypothetical protein